MVAADGDKLPPNLQTRHCRECGNDNMASAKRKLSGFNTESVFTCPDCAHEVSLASEGAGGVYLASAIIATTAIGLIMWVGKGFSKTELIVLVFLFAVFASPMLIDALKRRPYPVTGMREPSAEEKAAWPSGPSDPIQKGISWMDGFGFVKGFFGLFIFIALWFAFWAIVGLIKESFF